MDIQFVTFYTVLLFLIFADKSALYIWFLTSILS